jgi:hypothetical protein
MEAVIEFANSLRFGCYCNPKALKSRVFALKRTSYNCHANRDQAAGLGATKAWLGPRELLRSLCRIRWWVLIPAQDGVMVVPSSNGLVPGWVRPSLTRSVADSKGVMQ